MRQKLMAMLEAREDEMIQIRRHLHEYPEVSFHEKNTSQYIIDFYEGKDIQIETNVGNGYGCIVTIKGKRPGKTIALRADFDALPIKEEADVPFISKNEGVMHACAHDAHTAYLLILADCLIQLKNELAGTIKIIHQHAEEVPPGGAKSIVESGALDDVEHVFGIHLLPLGDAGFVGYNKGFVFNGRASFKLKINGRGGHGSAPDLANDAIVAGAHFVTAIQTVVSRRLSSLDVGVITIGSFDGKGPFNVIKDHVQLEGDIRYLTDDVKTKMEQEVKRIVTGIEALFGVTCELIYENDYPPLYNDPELTDKVAEWLTEMNEVQITKVAEIPPNPSSEDFAYYAKKIPSCFFYIGCTPKGVENPYFNHHPKFDIDEDALLVAAKSVAQVICSYYKLP